MSLAFDVFAAVIYSAFHYGKQCFVLRLHDGFSNYCFNEAFLHNTQTVLLYTKLYQKCFVTTTLHGLCFVAALTLDLK